MAEERRKVFEQAEKEHIRVREEINKDLKNEFDLLHILITRALSETQ